MLLLFSNLMLTHTHAQKWYILSKFCYYLRLISCKPCMDFVGNKTKKYERCGCFSCYGHVKSFICSNITKNRFSINEITIIGLSALFGTRLNFMLESIFNAFYFFFFSYFGRLDFGYCN